MLTHVLAPFPTAFSLTGISSVPGCGQVAPIGNSPTWMTWGDLVKVAPLWLNMSVTVYKDKEARKVGPAMCCLVASNMSSARMASMGAAACEPAFSTPCCGSHPAPCATRCKQVWGWVEEMYAFSMAMYLAGLSNIDLWPHIMAQPPYDSDYELRPGRPFYINHYTVSFLLGTWLVWSFLPDCSRALAQATSPISPCTCTTCAVSRMITLTHHLLLACVRSTH